MIRVGILGAAGYTGGELIRLLLNHPGAEIVFANSESNAGNPVAAVHEGLIGDTDLQFTSEMPFERVDVVFFCFGHGKSKQFLEEHDIPERVRIIDLAQDFRVVGPLPSPPRGGALSSNGQATTSYPPQGGVGGGLHGSGLPIYGLPELNRDAIRTAHFVANPGCFATAIQLGLLPAAAHGLIHDDVLVHAITGSTGAGQKPGATTHFSWRADNLSIYKPFQHQHVPEIRQSLGQLQADFTAAIDFVPYRGPFARGIFATSVVKVEADVPEETYVEMYRQFYHTAAFTHYTDKALDLKQVVNTNKALVHVEKYGNKLLITSVIDNLLKGAVGQAVQNMNLMFDLDERTGLCLKASAF